MVTAEWGWARGTCRAFLGIMFFGGATSRLSSLLTVVALRFA